MKTSFTKLNLHFTISIILMNLFIINSNVRAHRYEIWIQNRINGTDLLIKFYPVGSLFNNNHIENVSRYKLERGTNITPLPIFRKGTSSEPPYPPGAEIKYIVGLDGISLDGRSGAPQGFFKLWRPNHTYNGYNSICWLGSDATDNGRFDNLEGIFGYGKYVLEFYTSPTNTDPVLIAQVPIDWLDFNYPNMHPEADLNIYIDNISDIPPLIKYKWQSGSAIEKNLYEDSTANGHIEVYRRFYGDKTPFIVTPSTDFAVSNNISVLNYPLNATQLPDGYATYEHINPQSLYRNLEIESQKKPHITAFNSFIIEDNTKLKFLEAVSENWTRFIVDPMATFTNSGSSTIDMKPYSELVIESGAIWYDGCGQIIRNNPSCIIVRGQHIMNCENLNRIVDNGGFEILEGGHLSISNNSKITYDDPNSFLKLDPNSSIVFGENSSLEFKNGAYLIANGCSFSSIDPSKNWKGIILENSGVDSIANCTFSNAKTAITLKNYPSGSFENRVIKNNTFNIPSGGDHKGIYGENNYNILIQDNVFNMPVTTQSGSPFYSGVFLKNSSTSTNPESAGPVEEDPETETPYSLNIIHNIFNNGSSSVILAYYTSNVLPYYIRNNTFNSASVLGLLGMKITGTNQG